jgi:hypothetical protein
MTLICYLIVVIFAVQRVQKLLYRLHPDVATILETSAYTSQDMLDMDELGFKLAFGAMDYTDRSILNDQSRLHWHVTLDHYKSQEIVEQKILNVHVCSEQDFDEFYPIVERN